MPANVRGFGDSPLDWYKSLPPVTKAHVTICLATTLAFMLQLIHPRDLMLHWHFIKKLQLWRLLTNYFFLGKFGIFFVVQILWILHYGAQLETSTYQHNTADYVYMYLFGMMAMNLLSTLIPFFNLGFNSNSLVFMLCYVWSKNFATTPCSLYGLMTIQGFYLPFVFVAFSLLIGGNWVADVFGILGGHLYYFLKVVHPAAGGVSLLDTPVWLSRLVAQSGIGTVPVASTHSAHPTNAGFRAFGGGGRRLGNG